ncbi:hypothetical protein [Bradyrhizobium sp. 138]|uniref:hypothetical protein n=1 Tax=Bradyrhizobium sp. 138 TaxID=2782615 RepID=UPI001FFA62AA|nr:hypothetical protein [Bradyrhizobium sp. 138]
MSIRISLLIAFGATSIGAILGITLGLLAAHFRGWVGHVILGCVVLASLVISLTTLSISLVGDWLRDRIDKTLSRGLTRLMARLVSVSGDGRAHQKRRSESTVHVVVGLGQSGGGIFARPH